MENILLDVLPPEFVPPPDPVGEYFERLRIYFLNPGNQPAGGDAGSAPPPMGQPETVARTRPADVTGTMMTGTELTARHFTRKNKQKRIFYFRDGAETPPPDKKDKTTPGANHECHHIILASRILKTHISDVQRDIFEKSSKTARLDVKHFQKSKLLSFLRKLDPLQDWSIYISL